MNHKKTLVVSLLSLLLLPLASCASQKEYSMENYILELDYKENFKILQLSDIHMANKDDRERQYEFLQETIDMASANMIVITGDSFTFATKTVAKELFSFFDKQNIPWTITFGNHDEQCYFPIDWLTGYLNDLNDSSKSNCLFKDIQDDNVFGNANFAINLMENNQIKEQLIIMDSNRYHYGDYIGYDYIHEDQIEWYKDLVDYTTSKNNNNKVHSLLFFHIPLPEFQTANDLVENGGAALISGKLGEPVSCPKYNSGFFDVIKEKSSTDGIFVGHDHVSNLIVQYQGIYLGFGITSTDRIYFDEELLGGTCITIKSDNSLEFNPIIRTYEEYK